MAAPALRTAVLCVLVLCFCLTPRSVASAGPRGDCKSQTVTVSTLPIMRHNDVALRGLDPRDAPAASAASDSKLFLSIRHDLPGELSIADDLENTELPYFVLEISGPALELGSVHWHQRWLENGTLHFHVLQESVALRIAAAAAGASTAGPDTLPTIPQRHVLHISIMGGLIALLILLLLLTLALYNRRGGPGSSCCLPASARHRPPMPPQKSASAEAGDEIHYIPSVLLGSHGLDSRRSNTRLLQDSHADADGTPVRETPILDDFDFENGLGMGTGSCAVLRGGGGDEDYGSQVTRTLESLGRTERDGSARSDISPGGGHMWGFPGRDETVESLVLKFKESFRGSSPLEMNRLQQTPTPSLSSGRHKRHRHSRGQGSPRSPISKTTLALLSVTSCFLAVACGMHVACPLTVRVTLHVPEHFVADGSVLVLSDAGRLDVGGWLNPARVLLFRQSLNASLPWLRDPCSERTLDPCEHLCDPDTGECSCKIGYQPDPVHPHLCLRHDWEPNQGPWPYTTFERGYDLVTGEQPSDKIFRFTYGMGRGLWLPYSKSLVVPPMELDVSPLAGCRTDLSVTEEPAQVREEALRSTHFESLEDLLDSFGPVRDCSRDNGGCTRNYHCVSERRVDSTGCVCPVGLRPMKDGSGCYDYRQGVDCSDGQNGGCEQLCLQQTVPMPDDTTTYNIHMFCSCVEEYRLGPDGRSCLLLSEPCPGGALCSDHNQHGPGDVMFWEMLHGFDNGTGLTFPQDGGQNLSEVLENGTHTESTARGQIFRVSFRERNVIQGLPQLPDGLQVTFLPTDQQCQVHLSDPVADRQQLEGQVNYSEVLGYPIVQQWTLRSNLHHVSLGARNLSPGMAEQQAAKRIRRDQEDGGEDQMCIIHWSGSSNKNFVVLDDEQTRISRIREISTLRQKQSIGSKGRMDEVCQGIPLQFEQGQGYHRDCYQRFTKNLDRLTVEQPEPSTSKTKKLTRMSQSTKKDNVLFHSDCIFCNKEGKISIRKGGQFTNEATTTFDYGGGETVKQCAEKKGDEKLLRRIRCVDLFCAEAKFHPSCRKKYTKDSGAWRSKDAEFKENQIQLEKAHQHAFDKVCQMIHLRIIQGREIMKLKELNDLYIEALENTEYASPTHRSEKLKSRLERSILGEHISITPSERFSSHLVYSKEMDQTTSVRMAYKCGTSDSIVGVAETLRTSILQAFETSDELPWPPTPEYLQNIQGIIPNDLQRFLGVVISGSEKETNMRLNRLVLSVGQDLCRAVTHGQWKMPKHILLCMTLHHLFRSKELVRLLNRFGHSENYSFSLEVETAIARAAQETSSLLSQEIVKNPQEKFVFQSEFDNFDQHINELTGTGSIHTAHRIMLQDISKDELMGETELISVAKTGERSLHVQPNDNLPNCYVSLRKSPVMNIKKLHYEEEKLIFITSTKRNHAWIMLRLFNSKMPGWSGFVSLTGNSPETLTIIGYYPVNYHPITEYKTIQECLRYAEEASREVGQNYVITTFDLSVCMKAYPLIWNNPSKYENHIILIGTFHLTCAYFHMIGKKMECTGLSDVMIEAGLIGSGSVHSVLRGKNYVRAMNCHKTLLESLERLLLEHFLAQKGDSHIFESLPQESKEKIKHALEEPIKDHLDDMISDTKISSYLDEYLTFTEEVRKGKLGKTARFWISYMDHVWIVLQLHEAVKKNDFYLYAHCISLMSSLFFSYDGQNYARYTTMFSAFIANIDLSHSGALDLLKQGALALQGL